MTAKKKNKNKQ